MVQHNLKIRQDPSKRGQAYHLQLKQPSQADD
jgi:hypothetical protein